jgi:hypothetical protein
MRPYIYDILLVIDEKTIKEKAIQIVLQKGGYKNKIYNYINFSDFKDKHLII